MKSQGSILVVAPYVGEFGWELMNWQGRVRYVLKRANFDRVLILGQPDRRTLYESSNHVVEFHEIAPLGVSGFASEDRRVDDRGWPISPDELRQQVSSIIQRECADLGRDALGATILSPEFTGRLLPASHQCFVELRAQIRITTDILLVPRHRQLASERNQPDTWWQDLTQRFEKRGMAVERYEPPFDHAVRQLSRSRLAIGGSTGGLHLASLCRCPHYVWGPGAETRWTNWGITNRQRYETIWNPFGTPCRYDGCGWQPSLEYVEEQSLRCLDRMGLAQGASAPGRTPRPMWRVKRSLARFVQLDRRAVVPWRIRRLLRDHVV